MKKQSESSVTTLPLRLLTPDLKQPRQEFDPVLMEHLQKSIAKEGIYRPIDVEASPDGTYLIIDGERRYRCAKALKLEEVPVTIHKPLSTTERLVMRFHMQELHAGWTTFDKARAIITLKAETGMSAAELADGLGMNQRTVEDYIILTRLSKRAMDMAVEKRVPFALLRVIGAFSKNIEKAEERRKLEEAFVVKIENGTIRKATDIRRFNRAFAYGGLDVVRAFIADKEMTPAEAFKLAGRKDAASVENAYYAVSGALSTLKRLRAERAVKSLDEKTYNVILRLKNELGEFVPGMDYIESPSGVSHGRSHVAV